jgi:hypothetical protein
MIGIAERKRNTSVANNLGLSLLKNISLTLYNKIIGIAALDQKELTQINKGLIQINKNL